MRQTSPSGVVPLIKFVDMFSGIGGFREGLTRAGGFECVGHCEIDKYANRSYNALFDTKGEWFIEDARKADPCTMPDFQLLCGGFPCQSFSVAGARRGFSDPRGTLFFEIARLVEARHPAYLILENVPGLLSHSRGETYATILNTLDRLGYGVEWQCLNSKDFGVPQSRNRVYIVGYLDERCRGKVFPFTETTGTALIQKHGGPQPIPPLSQKNCISKYSNFAMKSLYPTPAFCSRSVMICNVVVESACIGIPKRINGTVVTVECGRIEFAQKNSLSNFVKSYSGFVGIMKESALHRAQAISTPSNLPG